MAGRDDAPEDLAFEATKFPLQYPRDVQVTLTGTRFDIGRRSPFRRLVDPELGAADLYCAADPVAFHPPFRTSDQQVGREEVSLSQGGDPVLVSTETFVDEVAASISATQKTGVFGASPPRFRSS